MEKKNIKLLHNQEDIEKSVRRIAHEILEKNKEGKDLVLIGIRKLQQYRRLEASSCQ
jgi:pyrimidine operon attenuation protein/uracil phosphoribosyltransferase